jgi:hypothetical protein
VIRTPEQILFFVFGVSTSPVNMEQTECSETSAYKIQTQENHPKERLQHLEHGESFKSINVIRIDKSSRIRWTGNLARIGEERNAYSLSDGKASRENTSW